MRLFLAVELPDEARAELTELSARLRGECPGWRWVEPGSIHLTLRFLGEVDPERDRELRVAWREAVAPYPELCLTIGGTGVFPERSHPRVLWVGVADRTPGGALAFLAASLESAARSHGFAPEERPFRPHLTIARPLRGARVATPPRESAGRAVEIVVGEVTLFRSELLPRGARYTALDRWPLVAAASAPS